MGSKSISRIMALLMSVALLVTFMPAAGMTSAEKAHAAEGDWSISKDTSFYEGYMNTNVTLSFDVETDDESLSFTYEWFKEDASQGKTDSPSKSVKIDEMSQDWSCVVTDSDGYSETTYFTVEADRAWYVDDEYDETETYVNVKKDETTAELKLAGDIKFYEDAPSQGYSFTYSWEKYDEDSYTWQKVSKGGKSYNVTGITKSQDWRCVIEDNYGFKRTYDFYIIKGHGWEEDCLTYYYVNKGDTPTLYAKIKYDKGYNAGNLGLTFKWYKYTNGEEELINGATSDKYKAAPVNKDDEYRCVVTDAKDNKESIYFTIRINPKRAPLFNVAYAVQDLKEPEDITLGDKTAVDAAKAKYDALTEKQKEDFSDRYLWYEAKLNMDVYKVAQLQAEADKAAAEKAKTDAESKKAQAEQSAQAAIAAKKKAEASLAKLKYKNRVKAAKAKLVRKLSVKAKKGRKAAAKWKAVKGASGYQLQYSTNKKFKKAKKSFVKGGKKKKAVIKKLKAGKKYFVRVRTYSKVKKPNGKKRVVYGKWSTVKKIKAKK